VKKWEISGQRVKSAKREEINGALSLGKFRLRRSLNAINAANLKFRIEFAAFADLIKNKS
jgi:hypothetical protein